MYLFVLSECEQERNITCAIFCLLGPAIKVNRPAFDAYDVNINQTILIRKKKSLTLLFIYCSFFICTNYLISNIYSIDKYLQYYNIFELN